MRRFELVDGTSSKFWEVSVAGSTLTTRWGKIGTDGQSKDKAFATPAAAQKEHDKLVAEKTGKGYSEVGGSGPKAPRGPIPEDAKEILDLVKKAGVRSEPMTRVYIMSRGKTAPAKDQLSRAGGKTIGIDEASRPRVPKFDPAKHPSEFMHHLWTIDLDEVPELRSIKSLAKARAVALFIANAPDNECFEPGIGRNYTKVVPILEADLAKGEWATEIKDQPPGAVLSVYPVDVPTKLFDTSIDFFEYEESDDEKEQALGELYSTLMSADRLCGEPMYFQGDDHKGEFLGQFSEAIVDVNLGDAGTMYVFSDLAFWACH